MLDENTHDENGELNFLPEGYELPSNSNNNGWLNGSDIKSGTTHRVRIMGSFANPNQVLECWEGWNHIDEVTKELGGTKRQPMRMPRTPDGKDKVHAYDEKGKAKLCWLVTVYHYESKSAKIWSIPQRTIQDKIMSLIKDKQDWGNPNGYDLKISREGTLLETEWNINPATKSTPTEEMYKTIKEAKIDCTKVFENDGFGGNPFGALGESDDLPF